MHRLHMEVSCGSDRFIHRLVGVVATCYSDHSILASNYETLCTLS
jgi:hypothetical protein